MENICLNKLNNHIWPECKQVHKHTDRNFFLFIQNTIARTCPANKSKMPTENIIVSWCCGYILNFEMARNFRWECVMMNLVTPRSSVQKWVLVPLPLLPAHSPSIVKNGLQLTKTTSVSFGIEWYAKKDFNSLNTKLLLSRTNLYSWG